ncbi:hypothetical protein H8E77_37545 [bacterium]|nr:hypothetical protein [bacterium]
MFIVNVDANGFVLDLPIQNDRPEDARGGLANPPQNLLSKLDSVSEF